MNILDVLRGLFQGPGLQQPKKDTSSGGRHDSGRGNSAPARRDTGGGGAAPARRDIGGGSFSPSSGGRNIGRGPGSVAGAITGLAQGAGLPAATAAGADLLGVLQTGGREEKPEGQSEPEPQPRPKDPKNDNIWTDSPQAESWKQLGAFFDPERDFLSNAPESDKPRSKGRVPSGSYNKGLVEKKTEEEIAVKKAEDDRQLLGFSGDRKELTRDEYFALSPRQRDAIDYNTALVAAVEADQALAGTEMDDDYKGRVDSLFGKDGGSDVYAPNTVAFLESIGYQGTKSNDLDNFLNLQAGITDIDLENLAKDDFKPEKDDVRGDFALNMVSTVQPVITETLRNGQTLLDSFRASSNPEASPRQFSGEEREYLDMLVDLTLMPDSSDEEVAGFVGDLERELGITPNETAKYVDLRLSGLEKETAGLDERPDVSRARTRFIRQEG